MEEDGRIEIAFTYRPKTEQTVERTIYDREAENIVTYSDTKDGLSVENKTELIWKEK